MKDLVWQLVATSPPGDADVFLTDGKNITAGFWLDGEWWSSVWWGWDGISARFRGDEITGRKEFVPTHWAEIEVNLP